MPSARRLADHLGDQVAVAAQHERCRPEGHQRVDARSGAGSLGQARVVDDVESVALGQRGSTVSRQRADGLDTHSVDGLAVEPVEQPLGLQRDPSG